MKKIGTHLFILLVSLSALALFVFLVRWDVTPRVNAVAERKVGSGSASLTVMAPEAQSPSPQITATPVGSVHHADLKSTESSAPTDTPFQPLSPTLTPSITPSSSPTLSPTTTPTSAPTETPTDKPTPTLAASAQIEGLKGRWPAYSLNCESRSAVDWAAYFGVQIDEMVFFNALPVSDNPDEGFVGYVDGPWGEIPPNDYGVHAEPVAEVLSQFGVNARALRGMSWRKLRAEIMAGRPVIVWVIGRVGLGTPVPYTDSNGDETVVARFEHTVIITGYSKRHVYVLDGYWVYTRPINDFLDSWAVLGNMAVVKMP
jgi:uncharacterized protein YvpB